MSIVFLFISRFQSKVLLLEIRHRGLDKVIIYFTHLKTDGAVSIVIKRVENVVSVSRGICNEKTYIIMIIVILTDIVAVVVFTIAELIVVVVFVVIINSIVITTINASLLLSYFSSDLLSYWSSSLFSS